MLMDYNPLGSTTARGDTRNSRIPVTVMHNPRVAGSRVSLLVASTFVSQGTQAN